MNNTPTKPHDPKLGLQGFLLLDGSVRLFIWWSSIALTVAACTALESWSEAALIGADLATAWHLCAKFGELVILYNFIYVAELVILRLPIPTPKEGRYEVGPGKKLGRQLLYSALIAALTKARYDAPFPGFLVFHIANLPPMRWLMGPIFGPKSRSCYVAEPTITDPHLVTIGRNVVIGLGSTIAAHYQEQDDIIIKRTIIEDDVLIGGHVAMAGVHVKRGAVIGAGSIVLPGSAIGENEYWSGNPARRRRTRPSPVGRDEDTEG